MKDWTPKDLFWIAGAAAILAIVCDLMMLSVVLIPPAELWVALALMLGASAVFGTLAAQYAVI
jgi:hypothetical protein